MIVNCNSVSLGASLPSISLPTENSIPCNTVHTVQPIRTILITLRYHGETAHPPPTPLLAPVRPRPYAEAPGRDRPDSSLPPTPPVGGKITLQNPSTRIAEYCS